MSRIDLKKFLYLIRIIWSKDIIYGAFPQNKYGFGRSKKSKRSTLGFIQELIKKFQLITSSKVRSSNLVFRAAPYFLYQLIGMIVPVFTIPFVINYLSLEVFGVVTVYLAYFAVVNHITLFAMNIVGPQYILQGSELDFHYRKFIVLVFRTIITTVFYFCIFLVVVLFEVRHFEVYEYLIFFCSYFVSLLNYQWYFNVKRSSFILVCGIIAILGFTFVLIVVLKYFGHILPSDVSLLLLFTSPIGSGLVSMMYYTRDIELDRNRWLTISHVFSLLKENVSFYFSQLISYLYVISSPIVLSVFITSEEIAVYYIFEKFTFSFISIGMLVFTYKYADVLLAFHKGKSVFFNLSLNIFWTIFVLIMFLFVTFFCLKNAIISFFTGEITPLDPSLVFLGFFYAVLSVFGSVITVYLKLNGHDRRVVLINFATLVLTAIFGYVLLSEFGVLGWIMGMVFGQFVGLGYYVFEFKKSKRCVE